MVDRKRSYETLTSASVYCMVRGDMVAYTILSHAATETIDGQFSVTDTPIEATLDRHRYIYELELKNG